jgi:hypothetical protein
VNPRATVFARRLARHGYLEEADHGRGRAGTRPVAAVARLFPLLPADPAPVATSS